MLKKFGVWVRGNNEYVGLKEQQMKTSSRIKTIEEKLTLIDNLKKMRWQIIELTLRYPEGRRITQFNNWRNNVIKRKISQITEDARVNTFNNSNVLNNRET